MTEPQLDSLSPLGRKLLKLEPDAYAQLVPTGAGNPIARDLLQGVHASDLIEGAPADRAEANALLAALWLRYDWLDQSHRISQSIETPTGSFWHAIMHRREGDFSNSKYWYARCASHPVQGQMANQVGQILHALPADKVFLRLMSGGWNPSAFVDLVESVQGDERSAKHAAAVSLQQLEWRLLFDHCTRAAAGK